MWYSIDCLLGKERIEPRRFLLSATAFLGHFFYYSLKHLHHFLINAANSFKLIFIHRISILYGIYANGILKLSDINFILMKFCI